MLTGVSYQLRQAEAVRMTARRVVLIAGLFTLGLAGCAGQSASPRIPPGMPSGLDQAEGQRR